MRTLRVFYLKHVIKNAAGLHPSYDRTPSFADFPEGISPQNAYRQLLQHHGSIKDSKETATIMTGEKTLVAPGKYITINSHTYVDPEREKAEIPTERVVEQDLLDGRSLFAAQGKKPEPKYVPRGKK